MTAEPSEVTLTVRCACGWEVSGPQEDVVSATIEHGRRIHNMVAGREDVLAMAVEVVPPRPPSET